MWRRIVIDILLFILAFMAPWWVSVVIALLALAIFDFYIEVLFLGLLLDSLYNAPIIRFYQFQFIMTLMLGIILVGVSYIKTLIRFD